MDWSFGIFPMMTIMAGMVLGTMGLRFVYIDKQYSDIVKKHEDVLSKLRHMLEDNTKFDTTIFDHVLTHIETKGMYESRRENNRRIGLLMDFIAMVFIIMTGILVAGEIIPANVLLIGLTTIGFTMVSAIHTLIHADMLRKERL